MKNYCKMLKALLIVTLIIVASTANAQWQSYGTPLVGFNSGDFFGSSVALNSTGTIMAVGSPNSDLSNTSSGDVRVYENMDGNWTQIGNAISGMSQNEFSGGAISLNEAGSIIAIGAKGYNNNQGVVYVLEFDGSDWQLKGTPILGAQSADNFGHAVSLNSSGERLAVGAPLSSEMGIGTGHVNVYQFDGTEWQMFGNSIIGQTAGEGFGYSVKLDADGLNFISGSPTLGSGIVSVYEFSGAWTAKGSSLYGELGGDHFGQSVSISDNGNTIAVGADSNDLNGSDAGAAYVYEYNGSWNMKGSTIIGDVSGDLFGFNVDLSADASQIAIAAINNDQNGSDAGQVSVYEFQNSNWALKGQQLYGDQSNDYFGGAIDLSADGSVLAIGAYNNSDNGTAAGHVKAFKFFMNMGACLIGDYSMDGNMIDALSINDGINNGASPDNDRFDAVGSSLYFNGSNSYASITGGLNAFPNGTVSLWVYANDLSVFNPIFSRTNESSTISASLSIVNGFPEFILSDQLLTSSVAINDNQWHHIVCRWNGMDMSLFVDAMFAGSVSSINGTGMYAGSYLDIGRNSTGLVYYGGRIDDFKIFDCAISDDDIINLYHENGYAENNTCIFADYPFNNSPEDVSGNNIDGDFQGYEPTAITDRFDNPISAYQFDGVNDRIEVPHNLYFENGTVSFSAWFNADNPAIADHQVILSKDATGGGQGHFTIKVNGGNLVCYMQDIVSTYSFNDIPINSGWYHVVFTSNGMNEHKLYINGSLVETKNDSWSLIGNALPFFIGGSDSGSLNSFQGKIDDVKLYSCDISYTDVIDLYHKDGWDIQPFVTECYNFNDNQVPENWLITNGDSAYVGNGKFMTVYTGTDESAEMSRLGTMPENVDSLIIEWDCQVSNAQPYHFTGVGLNFNDTAFVFVHMQSMTYDYGVMVSEGNNESNDGPMFDAIDSMAISPGIYKNKLICTNTEMYFTSQKQSNPNIKPFTLHINPFDFQETYSLKDLSVLTLMQQANTPVGYNWMDNVCIQVIERTEAQSCNIASYGFNANLADNSGNGFHLSVENGPITYASNRFGVPYKAINLNDNNQELSTAITSSELVGDFALSTWINPQAFDGNDTCMIFSNYPEDGFGGNAMMLGVFESTGQIFFGHLNTDESLIVDLSSFTVPTGVWSHIVLLRDTFNMNYTLYFNGDSVHTFHYPVQPSVTGLPSTYSISESNSHFNFYGQVDDIYLSKCLLDENQIDSLYHIGDWPQSMCDDLTISVTPTDAACNDENGTATVNVVGGSGIYTIDWSNGDTGNMADELEAGMHSVQVTDDIYGCMLNKFFNINNIGAPALTITEQDLDCYNNHSGELSVGITGGTAPYQIDWSNGAHTNTISNLAAGSYMITVIDASDCMVTEEALITQALQIQASFDITNSSCGASDGAITVNVSGGTGMYTYAWSNGAGDVSTISNISASNYSVTVEDENACTRTFTTGFSDSGSPIAMIDSVSSASCGELGNLYISVSGGSGSYDFDWSNGEETEDLVGFEPGEYWLTVTDGTCMTMLSGEIPFNYPQTQEICVVTVDPNTATNLVVWEKEVSSSIDHYNIYREGFVAGDYQLVGSVLYDDMSEYSDPVASPFNRSWKYKVSAVDACGNETDLSGAHKTIHLTINVGLGGSINLLWDDYAGFNYTSFYVNKHTTAGGWVVLDQMPTYLHSYSDTPADLFGLWYTVTVDAPGQCVPTSSAKASGGPYYQSVSNIEDEGAIDTKANTLATDFDMQLFPNPNNGNFILGFNNDYSGTIEILDVSGKVIHKEPFTNIKKWNFDNDIESGIYMIRVVVDNNATQTLKMIVE